MTFKSGYWMLLSAILIASCGPQNPNTDASGGDELKALEVEGEVDQGSMDYHSIYYVPIYSDIYVDVQHQKTLLAATLSIRNTNAGDSLFVSRIEYYNTDGDLVREFIDNTISLPPMSTVNYVIEREDDTGGSGANFIVAFSSRTGDNTPLIQAVMVGEFANKGFAFSTDGYPLH